MFGSFMRGMLVIDTATCKFVVNSTNPDFSAGGTPSLVVEFEVPV